MAPRYTSPLMQFFGYVHLPEHLQEISKPFTQLAEKVDRRMAYALEAWVFKRSAELGMHTDAFVLMLHDLPDNLRAAMHQSELALQRLVDAKDAAVRVHVAINVTPVKVAPPEHRKWDGKTQVEEPCPACSAQEKAFTRCRLVAFARVVINGTGGFTFTGDDVSYQAIVTASGNSPDACPVVKYKEAGSLSEIGYLRPGQTLCLRDGMIFTVGGKE